MTLKKNTAELGTDGNAVTTGASGGDQWNAVNINAGSTFHFEDTSPIHGFMSYSNASTTAATTPLVTWNDTAATSAAARFYFRFVTVPDSLMQIGVNFRGNGGGTSLARTEFNLTTPTVRAVMGSTTSSFSGSSFSAGTVYRLEALCTGFNGSSGAMTVNTYVGESTSIFTSVSLSGATTGFTCDMVRFGKFSATGNWSWVLDSLAADVGASAQLGPEVFLSPGWTTGYAVKIG